MKTIIIIFFFLFILPFAKAQDSEPWFAFWDEETYLIGFKDTNGFVKIEPRFMGLTAALRFNNIIAVMEESNGTLLSYYLLKNGKKIGNDSLYIWDMSFDCESDGLIRFRDSNSDKVGYFDSLGAVVIPAVYSDASPFRNGVATAITGAKRICWEGGEFSKDNPCEHWDWKGGRTMLIDKSNNILIDDFDSSAELDLYSLQINDNPSYTSLTETFKGVNGKYYSFINVEKHFKNWLFETLLADLNKDKLLINTYNAITFWEDSLGWVFEDKINFIDLNSELLIFGLLEIKKDSAEFFIFVDGLNPFIYSSKEVYNCFDDCGKAKIWMCPVLQVVINHGLKTDFYQNHFEFLKTTEGYKLISVTLRGDDLN